MFPLIFGIVVIAAIYFSIKAKDEKKLRKDAEYKHNREKESIKSKNRIFKQDQDLKYIINSIKQIEQPLKECIERKPYENREYNKLYSTFDYIKGLCTTITSGTVDETIKVVITEELESNTLKIDYFIMAHRNDYKIEREILNFDDLNKYNVEDILNKYKSMKAKLKEKVEIRNPKDSLT